MPCRNYLVFWTAAFAALAVFLFVFKAVLLPFVLGIVIAYMLNPLARALGRLGLARGPAALLILCSFFAFIVVFIMVLAPILYNELRAFSADWPSYIERLRLMFEPLLSKAEEAIGQDRQEELGTLLTAQAGSAANFAGRALQVFIAGGAALFDTLSTLVLMPFVAYYMMKEWPALTHWAEDIIPRQRRETVIALLCEIDRKISGFIRGQVCVALILAFSYGTALSLLGLNYGFLIGFTAGLLSIIPLAGSAIGLVIATGVAWLQAGDWTFTAMAAGIFLTGQFIEGNILTPRLVGQSAGLHPLWVFFALLAGASLLGITGMLIAVPVAASAGVLLSFALRRYKTSRYYDPAFESLPPPMIRVNSADA
jgi:predicted PurR-regulated permease PerM